MSKDERDAALDEPREPRLFAQEDFIWDEELGWHRCPLGYVQTVRPIISCLEKTCMPAEEIYELRLYVHQRCGEGCCDVVVVEDNEYELWLRVVMCCPKATVRGTNRHEIGFAKRYIDSPLGDRRVYDADTQHEVPVKRLRCTPEPGPVEPDDIPF